MNTKSLARWTTTSVVVLEDKWVRGVQRDLNQANTGEVFANQIASK